MAFLNSLKFVQRVSSSSIPKLTRAYAAPAAQKVQIPITLFGIEGRYATALYGAAAKNKSLETVEAELKQVKLVVENDSKLLNFLEDPSLSPANKKEGVHKVLSKQGKISDITKNFFDVLAENGRLGKSHKIIDAYLTLMTAHRGEVPVTIISAKSLESGTLSHLEKTLNKTKLASSKKLIIKNKVDPSILGGLIIEFGTEKTIDLSVASKIAKYNKLLIEKTAQDLILDIEDKKTTLNESRFYQQLKADTIQASLSSSVRSSLVDIVCYGIGSIKDSHVYLISTISYGYLLFEMKISGSVYIYDPILTSLDFEVLVYYGIILIEENEKAKRIITQPTLFYMPHCPIGLYNNVIGANWQRYNLTNLLLIGNRLEFYAERCPSAKFKMKAPYLSSISFLK
ncbi:4652_t:CDS:10 [Ambispora leptoticha]|uniref:ATP synthase subunit 5, mitochondrial n=1 Tax=Ambispora leptoticha TaxID=144679 RepID=A0A9N9BIU3_9GLOM|nr:4652_t:CDS:10 [Ambispora leptoticha]